MSKVVIKCSTVTGIHRTNVSSCEEVTLLVLKDNSIPHIDPDCMKVVFPTTVPTSLTPMINELKMKQSKSRLLF